MVPAGMVVLDDSITGVTGEEVERERGGEEDQDDAEYNYLADQREEEKEEFRNDRAVRISRT